MFDDIMHAEEATNTTAKSPSNTPSRSNRSPSRAPPTPSPQDSWLETTCSPALSMLVDLYVQYSSVVDFLLDDLLALLQSCIVTGSEELSAIGVKVWSQLVSQPGVRHSMEQWSLVLQSVADIIALLRPSKFLSPSFRAKLGLQNPPPVSTGLETTTSTTVDGADKSEVSHLHKPSTHLLFLDASFQLIIESLDSLVPTSSSPAGPETAPETTDPNDPNDPTDPVSVTRTRFQSVLNVLAQFARTVDCLSCVNRDVALLSALTRSGLINEHESGERQPREVASLLFHEAHALRLYLSVLLRLQAFQTASSDPSTPSSTQVWTTEDLEAINSRLFAVSHYILTSYVTALESPATASSSPTTAPSLPSPNPLNSSRARRMQPLVIQMFTSVASFKPAVRQQHARRFVQLWMDCLEYAPVEVRRALRGLLAQCIAGDEENAEAEEKSA